MEARAEEYHLKENNTIGLACKLIKATCGNYECYLFSPHIRNNQLPLNCSALVWLFAWLVGGLLLLLLLLLFNASMSIGQAVNKIVPVKEVVNHTCMYFKPIFLKIIATDQKKTRRGPKQIEVDKMTVGLKNLNNSLKNAPRMKTTNFEKNVMFCQIVACAPYKFQNQS